MTQKSKLLILALSSVLLLCGCSAEWHLRKAIAKKPSLLVPDTILKIDTTVVTSEKVLTDTLVTTEYDTLVIAGNGIETKIIRVRDTLLVHTKVTPDTIRIIKQTQGKPRILIKEKETNISILWLLPIILLFALWIRK